VLYALGDPLSLVLLLLSFVRGDAARLGAVAGRAPHGDRHVVAERRTAPGPAPAPRPVRRGGRGDRRHRLGQAGRPAGPARRGALVGSCSAAPWRTSRRLARLAALGASTAPWRRPSAQPVLQYGAGVDLGAAALLLFGWRT
jgi:hypothetical protein